MPRLKPEMQAVRLVPEDICRARICLPMSIEGTTLVLAMAIIKNQFTIDDVQFISGYHIRPIEASVLDIEQGIDIISTQGWPDGPEIYLDCDGVPEYLVIESRMPSVGF